MRFLNFAMAKRVLSHLMRINFTASQLFVKSRYATAFDKNLQLVICTHNQIRHKGGIMQDWKKYVETLGKIHNVCEYEKSKLLDSLIKSKDTGIHSLLNEEYQIDGCMYTNTTYNECSCHEIATKEGRRLYLYSWEFSEKLEFEVEILECPYSHLIEDSYDDEPLEDSYLDRLPL